MKNVTKSLALIAMSLAMAGSSFAQESDQQVTISISKFVDGEQVTFERTYTNEEEMLNDPEYLEFTGSDASAFIFQFDDDAERIIDIRHIQDGSAFQFDYDFDMPPLPPVRIHRDGPHTIWLGSGENGIRFDADEFEKKLAEKMDEFQEQLDGLDDQLQAEIMESLGEIEELYSNTIPRRINRKKITIEEVDGDFGRRGNVNEDDQLELDNLVLQVMGPSLHLRFSAEENAEVEITLTNENNQAIYSRYFEEFSGTFTDAINLSSSSEGKYLLEIDQNGKRLVKKIVIE